jgi:hypothetical protein
LSKDSLRGLAAAIDFVQAFGRHLHSSESKTTQTGSIPWSWKNDESLEYCNRWSSSAGHIWRCFDSVFGR